MGFSGQEYWSGLPFSSPGDLSNPGIKSRSPALQEDSLLSEREDVWLSLESCIYCLFKKINVKKNLCRHGSAEDPRVPVHYPISPTL